MVASSAQASGPSLALIEGCLTALAIAVAFCWPRLGSAWFARVEDAFTGLARRRSLSVTVVGLTAFFLRLALLPLCPTPQPFAPDDFSFLLAADTFASGRLTNPTPAMWVHFETVHVTMRPTYMTMYFPAQGLVLAAGKVLTGEPWYGSLFFGALMCAAICWMLQAWLPPRWALLGGIIAIMRLCLFSYWVNIYSGGGGTLAALGGALVLGGMPRFMKTTRLRDALLMAVGVILLATSRPYEGLLLCLPVAFVLGRWALFGNNRPTAAVLFRRTALPLVLIIGAGAWMGYYDYRAFGNPLTPPYSADRATYAMAPYFVWQSVRPEPVYRHVMMRKFYYGNELNDFKKIQSLRGYVPETLLKAARALLFYAGITLLIPLIMVRRVFLDRRIRFLVLCCLLLAAGELPESFLIPHYVAPFTVAFYAIGLQALRHLRVWKPEGQPVGVPLVRLIVLLCVALAAVRAFAVPLRLPLSVWPAKWAPQWYGSGGGGVERAKIEAKLERMPGKQLVLVRYAPDHDSLEQWVYNTANIDDSKVIWAWDMGETENRELIDYYKDRTVWVVQPDTQPVALSPDTEEKLATQAVAAPSAK